MISDKLAICNDVALSSLKYCCFFQKLFLNLYKRFREEFPIEKEIDPANQAVLLLERAGLRKTENRLQILDVLIRTDRPVSHRDLSKVEGLEGLDRVTLYRNLAALENGGIVQAIIGEDGVKRFMAHRTDQVGCPGNHPHFVCLSCRIMICLTDQRLPTVDVPEGYTVTGKQLIVYGYCSKCAKGKSD